MPLGGCGMPCRANHSRASGVNAVDERQVHGHAAVDLALAYLTSVETSGSPATPKLNTRAEILRANIRDQYAIPIWLPEDDPPFVVVVYRDRHHPH